MSDKSWENNSPKNLGIGNFLDKYSQLFPKKIEKFSENHQDLTKELKTHGEKIINRNYTASSMLFLFLLKIGAWKNPTPEKRLEKTIEGISENSVNSISKVFDDALKIYHERINGGEKIAEKVDEEIIDLFGSLRYFGKESGSRKMVSAILRFLDPEKYGTVDYRNWAVLSNTEYNFFEKPKLEPLADKIKSSKNEPIGTGKYLKYLKVIRKIGGDYGKTPAEVDMALFAYSDEIIPLQRGSRRKKDGSESERSRKIEKILSTIRSIKKGADRVAGMDWAQQKNEKGKKWANVIRGSANKILRNMENLAQDGKLDDMCKYYFNALNKKEGQKIGKILEKYDEDSLESHKEEVEKICRKQ